MKPLFPAGSNRVCWGIALIGLFLVGDSDLLAQPREVSIRPDSALITTRELPPIFNGTNLDGWIIRGGKATYVVEDGVIVGTCTVKGGGNTFLCTAKEYGDFILELEIKADHGLNSGVQIRSHAFDQVTTYDFGGRKIRIPAQRVHGYQVEVDSNPNRRWSGGIYDEARRNWLFPLATNSAAGQAFKFGEWNKYRIQCIGSSIKTWINGVPAADLVDAETLKGFIGLQVHASDQPDYQVHFRNVRLRDLGEHQWQTAWDCRSMDGMQQQGAAEWKLTDGVLQARHSGAEGQSGSLLSQAEVADFTVRFKYTIGKGAFGLTFRAPDATAPDSGFTYQFSGSVGTPNVAKSQDWNTVTVSGTKRGVVIHLNGHQLKDVPSEDFPRPARPGLTLAGGNEAEVAFKDFEILVPTP